MHEMGDGFKRELRSMLVRMSCMEHDFVVRSRGAGNLSGGLADDTGGLLLGSLGEESASVQGSGDGAIGEAEAAAVAAAAAASLSGASLREVK